MARTTSSASKVAEEARTRLKLAKDADGGNRTAALDDLKFAAGDQWPQEIEMARKLDRRPCLTINKTDTFVRSTVNNMRQQRPRIMVHPVADGADEQVAKVVQGLVRHIEVNSNADFAYDTGSDFQVRMGWGFWRLNTRYVSDDSFDQEIYIDAIKNPFSVYMDPSSTAPDGSDAQWCVITERIKRSEFKKLYPNAKLSGITQLGDGDDLAEWATKEEVVIAEYYRLETTPETLYLLSNGAKKFQSEMPDADVLEASGLTVISSRSSMRVVLKWSKVTALDELDSRTLPGKHIPVVPVYGAELLDNGKLIRYGMVRQLKDPQRMYNFWRTQETEFVALAPKAPWLMAEGQDEGREDEWNNANVKSFSSLKYKPLLDEAGNPLPPPMRQQPQAIPAASVNAAQGASEDLKAVAGMFDPALGAAGQETSGVMVERRQQQSDLSNFHFYDNLTRSIRWTGKLILEWLPHYYDTERVIRIIGEDNKPESVTINEKQMGDDGAIAKVLNDVTVGTFDVVMETGPGYNTKREQAFAFMIEMMKAVPKLGEVAGDLIMRQSDNPGASDIADRLAATNPLAQLGKDLPKDLDPKAKQLIVQAQGQVETLKAELQKLQFEKAAKVWGDEGWQKTEITKEHIKQSSEDRRLALKEAGDTHRAELAATTKVHDTNTRTAESWREAVLDARTDLLLGKDAGQQNDTN